MKCLLTFVSIAQFIFKINFVEELLSTLIHKYVTVFTNTSTKKYKSYYEAFLKILIQYSGEMATWGVAISYSNLSI